MRLLVIDTALDRVQAAVLARGGDGAFATLAALSADGRGQAERVVDLAMEALADAGPAGEPIDRIGVTVGPGSFTGLRVAIACARAFALVRGVPAVGVTTLAAFAREARETAGPHRPVLAVVDARHGACYAALDGAGDDRDLSPRHAELAVLAELVPEGTLTIGKGAAAVADGIAAAGGPRLAAIERAAPDVAAIARLTAQADPAAAPPRPLYLKPAAAIASPPLLDRVR